jgi:Putative zinc-finger
MSGHRVPRCTRAYDPRLREAVGAYLLGGLEPAEADEVSFHLSECESCRSEYAELADLVPLMALVTEQEAVHGPVRPEPAVLGRVLASSRQQSAEATRTERRAAHGRPRRTRLVLAAACVVLAAGGSAIGVRMSTHAATTTAWSTTVMVINRYHTNDDITAVADVTPAAWGSRISLKMEGVPKGYKCSMVVWSADGHSEQAGTWNAPSGGSFTIPATSSLSPDKVSAIDVTLPNGTNLMHIAHP